MIVAVAVSGALCGADWRQFRGNESTGVAGDEPLPVKWTDHQAWKVALPGNGASSPIVVDDRVVVTCASGVNRDRLHVICFSAEDGSELWHRQLWATGRTFCHPSSSVAANTPASDGERIFAFFSSNDLACFDLEGNLLWYRGLGHDFPKAGNDIGMASSPVVAGRTVVVQIESQADAFALGIDTSSGKTRWRVDRTRRANWSSPVAILGANDREHVVLLQSPTGVTAHEALSGEQLWEFEPDCAGIASTAIVDDVAFVPSGGITAIKPSLGGPQILWDANQLSPGSASPVVYRDRIYTINRSGVLACGDTSNGEILWRLRLKGRFWATPVAAGDHLHLVNSDGLVQVVKLGDKGELAATCELGEGVQGTPAAADGAVYVRSHGHLWKFAPK